jgi:predicted MPP superfamily phosphohydrolase
MFVTSGLGTSVLPVRFLNPPEIAVITLRAEGTGLQPIPSH